MNYEEKIKEARKTGKGIIAQFQEKQNYVWAVNEYDCPHCGAYFGDVEDAGSKPISESKKVIYENKKYEIPSDIEFMCNNEGYSWTEDCRCGDCGKMYSQSNGC